MANYLDKKELGIELRRLQRTRQVSPKLTDMLNCLFSGVASRYAEGRVREDVVGECWVVFLRKYRKIDTRRNAFSYLSSIARSVIFQDFRTRKNSTALLTRYYEDRHHEENRRLKPYKVAD